MCGIAGIFDAKQHPKPAGTRTYGLDSASPRPGR